MDDIERATQELGQHLFRRIEGEDSGSLFAKDTWYRKIMDWSMQNERFKTQMFRFVDVLPYLESSAEITRHLKEYFAESGDDLPSIFSFGLGLGAIAPGIMAGAVKKNVTAMAKLFITGETPKEARAKVKALRSKSITFTADLLGEATLSQKEAEDYLARYLELITDLAKDAREWSENPQIDRDEKGALPKVNVSVKVTALCPQIDEVAWDEALERVKVPLRKIFRLAMAENVFINLDQEQYVHKDFIRRVFADLLLENEFRTYPWFGIVVQAYLHEALADIEAYRAFGLERGTPFTVRLVKGAYWDFETVLAEQRGWPVPVFLGKAETDANYERCTRKLIEAYPHVRLAMGSHNVRSLAHGLSYASSRGLSQAAVEVQMLYGMAEPIKRALVGEGYRVREYATIGELIPGMAYLVRRLLENTSNESFLRSKFAENASVAHLLRDPAALKSAAPTPKHLGNAAFCNEPLVDFSRAEERAKIIQALKDWRAKFGRVYRPVVGGVALETPREITRENPSRPKEIVGRIGLAQAGDAARAVQLAKAGQVAWGLTPAHARADLLDKLAARLTAEKAALTALEVYEVGKTWREADGDVAEAIDFCRYYALEMRRLAEPRSTGFVPGEESTYAYHPRGVAVVIAPWNFPLAILTGMVTAAIVTGNAVIMKPAEQSSIIAAELYRLMLEVGFPAEVIHYLPGLGEDVGAALVADPAVHVIAFTGSKDVGLRILNEAAKPRPGQRHIKRVIAELGGKNAILVDGDADLDEAVTAVIASAFGFQGQKCSAASRVIVLEPLYERFLERLVEGTRALYLADPEDPRANLGPIIDTEACARLEIEITEAKQNHTLAFEGQAPTTGHFVAPVIFRDVDPRSALAQRELFGPVVAVIRASTLDQALEIANSTEYALTGALFSRSPKTIERVKREFEVGNLYINRGSTGALVGRHPFGGYKMSGVGSKTGGPDYLKQFMEPKVVTENTMRRGFVPAEKTEAKS